MAEGNSTVTPYILISGEEDLQSFLVVDKMIMCEVKSFYDLPFTFMAAYFVFNICYPRGCSNFFSFMEVITSIKASTTVKHFLSNLHVSK